MTALTVPPRKGNIAHRISECFFFDTFRYMSNGSCKKSGPRTFRRLAEELAALTLASNKEIVAYLKLCLAYITEDKSHGRTFPFKGEDEWISQVTKELGTAFTAKARAAQRTSILATQLAADETEDFIPLAVRTLPVHYLAPQNGHKPTARILLVVFHLREQWLSLTLLPLAPEWRETPLNELVSPKHSHSPIRPATINWARDELLKALGNPTPDRQRHITLHVQNGNDWLANALSDNHWTVVDDLPTLPPATEYLSVKQRWKSMPNPVLLKMHQADMQQKPLSTSLPDTRPEPATLRPKEKDALILALWDEVARLRQALGETSGSASD